MITKVATQPYQFGWFDRFCLWYPPGWLILFNRHWQHYKPDPDGWNWLEYGLFLLPGGFYLAFALRWLRLGGRSPNPQVIKLDPEYQQAFRQEVLSHILKHYFQGSMHNLENLPEQGPIIVAMNHAGMCFPWDFVGLGLRLNQQRDWFARPIAHPIFFDHPWLKWWLPPGWAEILGGVRAERHSFESAIYEATHPVEVTQERVLLYAPEGWRGLAKGWRHRYQLATFDPSFIRLSLRYRVPIVPVVCMGSENLHPFTLNIQRLAQWLKLPLFPISPLMLAFVLFPSMGVWAMKTQLQYYIQPVWRPWEEPSQLPQVHEDREHLNGWNQEATVMQLPNRATTYHMAEALRSRLQRVIQHLREQL